MSDKTTVKIFLKSGNTFQVKCSTFNVTKLGNEVIKIDWEGATTNIIYISLADVEAVIELLEK